jgi:tripartite-type tricarboxylate transporter receptor subunit TctC
MRYVSLLALLVMCALPRPAAAEFPDRPIHLVVPQAAGSATDTLGRIFGAAFSDALGQTVIIDDRPGGALTVGMDFTAKAPPDGYTLCVAPIGALALTAHLVDPLPYNVERDFAPIVVVTRGQMLLAVSPTTEFHSVKELIDFAKANPGKLLNASSSNGSPGHVDGELFKVMTGTNIVHVPYKGGAAAINDLIAGRVQVMFESLNSIAPFAKSGQVRPLAVTGEHRSPAFPDVPTVAEAGVPGYVAPTWTAIIAPAGTPKPIIDKLNAAVVQILNTQDVKDRFAAGGVNTIPSTPAELTARVKREGAAYRDVIQMANVHVD